MDHNVNGIVCRVGDKRTFVLCTSLEINILLRLPTPCFSTQVVLFDDVNSNLLRYLSRNHSAFIKQSENPSELVRLKSAQVPNNFKEEEE